MTRSPYTKNTPIQTVMDDPVFGAYGRLILPVEDWYYDGSTLGSLSLTWYNHIDPDKTVERRIRAIQANGTDAMIEIFPGLPHGFGLGTGTAAEGWLENAVAFWKRNMKSE